MNKKAIVAKRFTFIIAHPQIAATSLANPAY
jgi:hypothetical protein